MRFLRHLRRTFLTGLFAAVPVLVAVVVVYYVDLYTRPLAPTLYGYHVPFVGALVAVVSIYLLGLVVSTALARWTLRRLDARLDRMPLVRGVYRAWKQVSLSLGDARMWQKVALLEVGSDQYTLVFTSGKPLPGSPATLCVLVPSAPVPTSGQLLLVPAQRCHILELSTDEAIKYLLSSGNYLPQGLTCPPASGT
ncbi:MAG: DUF502 domain-containing protein [Tepidisphaerales bacterium]